MTVTSLSLPKRSDVNFCEVSAPCFHSGFLAFYWQGEGRGNDGEDQRRRIRRRSGWNVQHLQQSHCSAFTRGWLPLCFEIYPRAQKSEHLMEIWIDDRKSKNSNKYEMRAYGGKGSLQTLDSFFFAYRYLIMHIFKWLSLRSQGQICLFKIKPCHEWNNWLIFLSVKERY